MTLAQSGYPTKSIRLVVPFPPGAGTDTVARFVAQKLAESNGATIVVENKTGAGGAICAAEAAKAEPDGYTLLFVASPFTTVAASAKTPGYDPVRQFAPAATTTKPGEEPPQAKLFVPAADPVPLPARSVGQGRSPGRGCEPAGRGD